MSVIKKILVAALLCCVFASVVAMEVKVVEVSGKVEVQRDNKWVAVSKGDILPAGSVISTGFKSEAILSFDETVIKVKALTRLTIEQLFEKDGDKASSVYLDTGSISADVKPAENKRVGFSVKTPAATASVRGTSGDVYSDGSVFGTSGKWCITGPQEKLIFAATPVIIEMPAASTAEESSATGEIASVEGASAVEAVAAEGTSAETPAPVATTEPAVEPVAGGEVGTEPVVAPSAGEGTLNPTVEAPVVAPATIASTTMEDFDFSYPDDLGAVFVSAGENAAVSGGSFVTPQDGMIVKTTGSSGVQLLSETEKVSPVAPQVATETSKPASSNVVVPEKPKFGTVTVTITLP